MRQPSCKPGLIVQISMRDEVGLGDDADHTHGAVDYRQGRQPMPVQQIPCSLELSSKHYAHHIARHHVGAMRHTESAQIYLPLRLQKNRFKVIATNIEHLVITRENDVEIF